MPNRRKNAHPALQARGMAVAEEMAVGMKPPGWEELNQDERKFLQLLPFYGGLLETATAMGRKPDWPHVRKKSNPAFKEFVDNWQEKTEVFFRAYVGDMVGKGNVMMWELMEDPQTPTYVQMDIVKHLHKLAGWEPKGGAAVQVNIGGQHIHEDARTIFNNGKKEEGE